jgi:putative salt-induced outer membrane protein
VTSAERYRASYEGNYKFTPRFFALGLVQWEQDRFAGYFRRFTESFGAGYTIIDTAPFNWRISCGPAFRQTQLVSHVSESETSVRAETSMLWNLTEATVLTEEARVYLGGQDNTYASTTALTTKVLGDLSARTSFDITVESNPPSGIDNTNTITRFTLVYSF